MGYLILSKEKSRGELEDHLKMGQELKKKKT